MRSEPLKRTPKRARHGLRSGEGVRAMIVAAGLATILVLVVFMAGPVRISEFLGGSKSSKFLGARSPGGAGVPLAVDTHQDASSHRVGSIVFPPSIASRCEEWRFDNKTGGIVSADLVDCDARLSSAGTTADPKYGRMQGILDGFKK